MRPRWMRARIIVWLGALVALACSQEPASTGQGAATLSFLGACDASAAVLLDDDLVVVADDADDGLRLYAAESGGAPIESAQLGNHPGTRGRPRAGSHAIEGATRLADRIYLIGSHARGRFGRAKPRHRRLLAYRVVRAASRRGDGEATHDFVEPVGQPYAQLASDFEHSTELSSLGLESSILMFFQTLGSLSPDAKGLDVQGLAPALDGEGLWVGLANPLHAGRAILIPVRNPGAMTLDAEGAEIGEPILLDLGGRGILDMAHSASRGSILILAGRRDASRRPAVFEWSGDPDHPPRVLPIALPADQHPQALVVRGDGQRVLVLSDDGEVGLEVSKPNRCRRELRADGLCDCNQLSRARDRSFRGTWHPLPPA